MLKLDLLAIGAHPDDVELGAGGTLIRQIQLGQQVGVLDLTQGELGTRGSAELRAQEAAKASEIMGIAVRHNLGLPDGFFEDNRENQLAVIRKIRQHRPDVVIANAVRDRHIDHGRGSQLVVNACFLSGLRKIETELEGKAQEAWRPKVIYHYIQDRYIEPDFVVDITDHWEQKMAAVGAYGSQFYDPNSSEPTSPIATPEFMEHLKGRAVSMGRLIGSTYGE
ncbi:MAG: bacillithiol biosynthesis deacetylase BshB1, partial [Bacteroidota bacterium]